jgi:hypothetical protein
MGDIRIPSIVEDRVRPRARVYLAKVKDFVENECGELAALKSMTSLILDTRCPSG